jgi:AcrR family transcriptional regulator
MKRQATSTDASELEAQETHRRLLEAAGEVFAAKGFKSATVRDICTRAGANVAAINYHFGDKERLYAEVLRFAHACAMDKYPPEMGVSDESPPEDRLRAFIVSFLLRMFDEGRPAWHVKLMSREMVEPTAALGRLVKQDLYPRRDRLTGIVREITGPPADDRLLRHCVMSIVGQCLSFFHGRKMLERLYPEQKFDPAGVQERAEYIYRFSLAALRGICRTDGGGLSRGGAGTKRRTTQSKPRFA